MQNITGQNLGRYQLVEKLGKGGMADVYKAYDPQLGRFVALKVISPALQEDSPFSESFNMEARSLAAFSHPNIVQIYDFGEEGELAYLVMEYIDGGALDEHTGRPIPYRQAARWLLPVARALQYAHHNGVIHRDVKPANILIRSGQPVLSDFGISKIFNRGQTLARAAVGFGTPRYMSPEQLQGQDVDVRTDIYSLGVVLFELITGSPPFQADNPWGVGIQHIQTPPPRLSERVSEASDEIQAVLDRAMAKKTAERYADMGEMIADLERVAFGQAGAEPIEASLPFAARAVTSEDSLPQSAGWREEVRPVFDAGSPASDATRPSPPGSPIGEYVVPEPTAARAGPAPAQERWVDNRTVGPAARPRPGYSVPAGRDFPAQSPAAPRGALANRRLFLLAGALLAVCFVAAAAAALAFWPSIARSEGGPAAAESTRQAAAGGAEATQPVAVSPPPASTPGSSSSPVAQATSPAAPVPLPGDGALDTQVEQFLQGYYDAINRRDYEASWQMLSDQFKASGENRDQFDLYVEWWNSFDRVELLSVRADVVNPQQRIANAHVRLRYISPTRGELVEEYTYRVVFNEDLGVWQIDR